MNFRKLFYKFVKQQKKLIGILRDLKPNTMKAILNMIKKIRRSERIFLAELLIERNITKLNEEEVAILYKALHKQKKATNYFNTFKF